MKFGGNAFWVALGMVVMCMATKTESTLTMKKVYNGAVADSVAPKDLGASVSVKSDWGYATSLTGTYYLAGDTSKCFIVRANPNGLERGFEIEASAGISSTFWSGAGWAIAQNPISGVALIYFAAAPGFKAVPFYADGTGMKIDGVTYLRRLDSAPWQCTTLAYGSSGAISGAWLYVGFGDPNFCQIIEQDPVTGAFVMFYPSQVSGSLESGAGHFDATTNKGLLGGYNTGGQDGPYPIALNAAKDYLTINGGNAFRKLASCHSANYPQVSQVQSSLAAWKYRWVSTSGTSCKTVCENNNMVGVATGVNKNSGGNKYYVCRGSTKMGLVPGMNEAYAGYGSGKTCLVGTAMKSLASYDCLCQPSGTTSKWLTNGNLYTSCQDVCTVNGYDAMAASKSHDVATLASYFICRTCWNAGGWGCRPGYNLAQTGVPHACSVPQTGTNPFLFSCLCVTQNGATCPY